MSDTVYSTFQHYGTAAQRAAFTPSPAAGIQPIYIWYETDTGNVYLYDTSWHLISSSAVVTTTFHPFLVMGGQVADTYKVLGQVDPVATTLTTLYTVPAATSAIISSITVANRSATPTSFRLAVRPAGAAIANQHYFAYDVPIGANEALSFTLGLTLATTDVISVYATLATVSFQAHGVEKT